MRSVQGLPVGRKLRLVRRMERCMENEVATSQILVGHSKKSGLYLEGNGKPLEDKL